RPGLAGHAAAGHGPRQSQRQRRRHRPGTSAGLHRCPPDGDADVRGGPARRPLRPRHHVHRRRHGRGRGIRIRQRKGGCMMAQETTLCQRGGGFLLGLPAAAEVFTPEDLDAQQRLIGETAAGFGKEQVAPLLEKIENREHEHSVALMRQAGELGLLGIDIPTAYGGLGLSTTTSTLVTEVLGRYAGAFSWTFGAHTGIGTLPIVYFGNEDQKRRYLPKLASGQWIAAYALTEPDAGSDALAA